MGKIIAQQTIGERQSAADCDASKSPQPKELGIILGKTRQDAWYFTENDSYDEKCFTGKEVGKIPYPEGHHAAYYPEHEGYPASQHNVPLIGAETEFISDLREVGRHQVLIGEEKKAYERKEYYGVELFISKKSLILQLYAS